jgi:hypothetical protein
MEIREIFKTHRETWGGHNFISEWGGTAPPRPPSATGLNGTKREAGLAGVGSLSCFLKK